MAKLTNRAEASADYLGMTYLDIGQVTVETSVLSVEKTADKKIWIDTGPLTYTVRITNDITGPEGESVVNMQFKDFIDPEVALLDTGSVTVDGATQILDTDFSYNASTGLFHFLHLASIPVAETMVIEYRVTKKQ